MKTLTLIIISSIFLVVGCDKQDKQPEAQEKTKSTENKQEKKDASTVNFRATDLSSGQKYKNPTF